MSTSLQLRAAPEGAAEIVGRSVVVTMSTDQRDRYGDRISQDGTVDGKRYGRGLLLDEFTANSVVQPWHQYDALPLGSVDKVWKDSVTVGGRTVRRTRGRIVFAEASANPLAEQALQLFKAGHLRGVSIGFMPDRKDVYTPKTDAERKTLDLGPMGILFGTSMLWELSVAPLPANPGALAGAALRSYADVARDLGHRDLSAMVLRSLTSPELLPRTFDLGASAAWARCQRRLLALSQELADASDMFGPVKSGADAEFERAARALGRSILNG